MSKTKNHILKLLFENRNDYLSGQKISDEIGCSRTAVWKHIKELENEGYSIASVHKRGYKLIDAPDQLSEARIRAGLETERLGHRLVCKDELPSTQKEAQHLAEDGAEEGTVVLAEEQTSGRGRLGRQWHSPKGAGIWMSLIIRPDIQINKAPQFTLLTAAAVVKAVKRATGLDCEIKWPNDILYKGKKFVGILTECQAEAADVKAIIIGIGINVNTDIEDFPDELKDIATSLRIEAGKTFDRAEIIQAILKEIESLYKMYMDEGFHFIKLLWESYAISLGKKIYARKTNGDVIYGLAQGIDDEGVLLLRDDDGHIHKIYSADIELSSQ
ncbi:BirA family biotin operon repressor/biotin-[acetyl-CoA-carboxylase] ligase [Scopulibacillus daqui]|uniref:Bifunctional ligase/repressor BirA n=1 Tax=Scopulibacillus daqui TaxID=1469162 RepID=A0ABS2PZX6_9BACL|nr:biotin--[acetyl-CoA-carboxylase] ligase [Scopulibacillus daqui]MBM7645265.1 BirA family biotin operon repressor/biotin-[acetyl-CoA-carboxylase] ligase [Scopulibacillus daqui]